MAISDVQHKKRVFAEGVFDMIHANHLAYLREARALGDALVVGVTSDAIAESYKREPVIKQEQRMEMVAGLACVDEVILMDRPLVPQTIADVIAAHDISVVAYAGTAWDEYYRPAIDAGIFHRLDYHEGINTSWIVRRILASQGR